MLVLLTDTWWVLMLRGVLAILFGVLAWTFPGLTLAVLIVMFGAYSLVNGLLALFAAFSTQAPGRGWLFFEGILGIVVAAVAFFLPGMTAIALLALVAAWSLMTGALLIASAFVLRKELTGEWRLYLAGALSIVFSLLLVLNVAAGMLALVWLLGFYSVLFGSLLVALSLRVRHLAHEMAAAH